MQQISRRTHMPKCDFNKVACNFIEIGLRHSCSSENLLNIFRKSFSKTLLEGSFWLLVIYYLYFFVYEECFSFTLFITVVAKLSWKKNFFSKKYLFFYKIYIICRKKKFYMEKSFIMKNFLTEKSFFYREKYK